MAKKTVTAFAKPGKGAAVAFGANNMAAKAPPPKKKKGAAAVAGVGFRGPRGGGKY